MDDSENGYGCRSVNRFQFEQVSECVTMTVEQDFFPDKVEVKGTRWYIKKFKSEKIY